MWKNKRGISPLIATVLIIGFTVALAAVIMTWGQSFSKDISKSTEETTETQLACAQEVVFDVSSACWVDANEIMITVKNDGSREITNFTVRLYESENSVDASNTLDALPAFSIQTYSGVLWATKAKSIKQIELIPVILIGEKEVTCSQSIAKYLDVSKTETLGACS